MIREIEKKYHLNTTDIEIIEQKCELISDKIVVDKYLDTPDYKVSKMGLKVRIRDGKPELKIKVKNHAIDGVAESKEYTNIEDINNVLSKKGTNYEDLSEVLIVKTERKKYKYNYKGFDFIIDIDIFDHGERYEIELTFDNKKTQNAPEMIDEFREYLGLTGEQNMGFGKIATCAKEENPELFKIISETKEKINL